MLVVLTDQRTIFSIGSVSQSSLPSYFNKHYNSPMVDPPSKLDILAMSDNSISHCYSL